MHDTWPMLRDIPFPPLERGRTQTLQLNLGYRCNLSCIHCHVAAGPRRTETMDAATMSLALEVAAHLDVDTLDLTGGSPEMNPGFRGLVLNLVYNPNGAFLPPNQHALEDDYRRLLRENFGIAFNRLYTLANMPIQRYGSWLLSKGKFASYMDTLRGAHRDENMDAVMCRSTISVGYDGTLYDCDFNQMLKLPLGGRARHLRDLLDDAPPRRIAVAGHCYGCTAGQGSSCGGALS